MVIGLVIIGYIFGIIAAVAASLAGYSLFIILVSAIVAGCLGLGVAALLAYWAPLKPPPHESSRHESPQHEKRAA